MKIKLYLLNVMLLICIYGTSQQNKGCSLNINSNELQNSFRLYPTTGIAQLDQIINLDMFTLYDLFGVKANIFMYQDDDGPNAQAIPVVSDQRLPDGTIIFGVNLMKDEFRKSATGLGFAIPGIIAHEMGHILQFSKNCNMPVMQMELQADFLAGYYLSLRSELMQNKGIPVYTFAPEAFKSFFEKGEYEFNNPSHHGTPEQRLAAVTAGYNCELTNINDVYEAGEKYVNQYSGSSSGTNSNSYYSGNSNSSNPSLLNKLINIFVSEQFNEIMGTQIIDEENSDDNTKSIIGDCKNYNSKLIFTDVFQTRISSCKGGMMNSADKIRMAYQCDFTNAFNTNSNLSNEKFSDWTKLINDAAKSDYRERIKDGNYSTTTTRTWSISVSNKSLLISLRIEKFKSRSESSVSFTLQQYNL